MRYISSFTDEQSKKVLLGAIVADAATLPLHWIYDRNKLRKSIKSFNKNKCEFNSAFRCPYYHPNDYPGHYKEGFPSPNGEQLLALLDIITESKDDEEKDGNWYALKFHSWLQSYTGRKDGPAKIFETNYTNGLRYPDCGADDDQAMSFYKSIISFATNLELEPLVRFHQNNDMTLDCATFYKKLLDITSSQTSKPFLEIYNENKIHASPLIKPHLDFLDEHLENPSTDKVLELWGKKFRPDASPMQAIACHNPQAFVRILHVLIHAKSFKDGIRKNILLGGSNVLTGMAIGSVLALYYDVPETWISHTKCLNHTGKRKLKDFFSKVM